MSARPGIPPTETRTLRQRAEATMPEKRVNVQAMAPPDVQALVHELQVHQVELEIQNEDLRTAQMELAEVRDRYLDLYQFAPVGYLTVDARNVIREANLTASTLVQMDRASLISRRLEQLVISQDRDACFQALRTAVTAEKPCTIELRAVHPSGDLRWILFEIVWHVPTNSGEPQYRVTLRDVTDRRLAEDALRELNLQLEQRVAERTSMSKLLNDVATAANDSQSIEQALDYTLRCVCQHSGWSFGQAYLPDPRDSDRLVLSQASYDEAPDRFSAFHEASRQHVHRRGEGLPGKVYASAQPQWANDVATDLTPPRSLIARDLGIRCGAAFPILAGRTVVGVLEFFSVKLIEPTERMLESMTLIGTQLGRVVELERFEHELSRALLDEQQSIGAELHDTVVQDLAAAALLADHVADNLKQRKWPEEGAVNDLSASVREGLKKLRETVRGIVPPIGVNEPLRDILEELLASMQQRYQLDCVLQASTPVVVGIPDVALHLYRIVSEAVSNAARHARASRIVVRLDQEGDTISIRIRDDGAGMPAESISRGSGLRIMRHRARMIDASMELRSSEGEGTEVICKVPLGCLRRGQSDV